MISARLRVSSLAARAHSARLFRTTAAAFSTENSGHVYPPVSSVLDKVLIANRGEIACRVIETCRRLGIKTVAVYSDADAKSKHVNMADEAVHIGPAPASESYLLGAKIIEAMKLTDAKAVHPGYGFLSENTTFAQMCKEAGRVFIGPPPSAITAMGSKSVSKRLMIDAGVPVTPGYHGEDQDPQLLKKEADKIGYPVLIKAVSGGGGKGMRLVWKESEFLDALESCQREALKSFSDDRVLLERFVQAPRHIEFQVFGDTHGNAVHLFERDCSTQRRHQKVLEESPAPYLSNELRMQMGDAAVAAAKAVGYTGAGTVEFLFDTVSNEFFFCEMNTRLQVEHPVTEMVTGLDLVELQLRVAAGQPLPLTQADVKTTGHAIEARVYAENPVKGFLPATGHLHYMSVPKGDNVRVDSGVRQGDDVSIYYDPMIAKLITWGTDRAQALSRLSTALHEFRVGGLPNNIDFLHQAATSPQFVKGGITTKFLEEHGKEIVERSVAQIGTQENAIAAALFILKDRRANASNPAWGSASQDWRLFADRKSGMALSHAAPDGSGNVVVDVETLHRKDGHHIIKVGNDQFNVEILPTKSQDEFCLVIDGHQVKGTFSVKEPRSVTEASSMDVWIDGRTLGFHLQMQRVGQQHAAAGADTGKPSVHAPMPGKVVRVMVKEGATVTKNQPLMILEAMKMEHVIAAPVDGTVNKVLFEAGSLVNDGVALLEVEPKA